MKASERARLERVARAIWMAGVQLELASSECGADHEELAGRLKQLQEEVRVLVHPLAAVLGGSTVIDPEAEPCSNEPR